MMEFEVTTEAGVSIIGPFEGVENLMSGSARKIQIKFSEEEAERDFVAEAAAGRV